MNKFFSGAYGIEIPFNATGNKTNFPDIPFLRGKRIKHIDFCSYDQLNDGFDSQIIASAENTNILFTLVEKNTNRELIQSLPATLLDPVAVKGDRLFINKVLDIPRSYIDTTSVTAGATTGTSIYLVFYFDDSDIWGTVNTANKTAIQPLEITLIGLKTYFKENKNLLNEKFQNIILEFPSLTHTGNDGISDTYIGNKFITLSRRNKQYIYRLPLYLLHQRTFNFPLRFQNVKVDLQSSYIETLTTTANDLKTVFFNVITDEK